MIEIDKIYNENCLQTMSRMPDDFVDLTVTSPPYDNLRDYNGYSFDFENIAKELFRITKLGGVVVWIVNDATINGSETGTSFKQALFFKECGFNLHDTMIWEKMSPFTHTNRYIANFEYMFVFSKGSPKTVNLICDRKNKWAGVPIHGTLRQSGDGLSVINGKGKRDVKEYGARLNTWDIPSEKNNKTGHPAVFPMSLVRDHIVTWSNDGDIVYDCFLGSGTTAVVASKAKRHFIGSEISEEYFEIAKRRIDNLLAEPTIF